jgi:hypothetical protein
MTSRPEFVRCVRFGPKHVVAYLHRSRDRGESWQIISPDLTTNDPDKQRQHQSGGLTIDNTSAENHCTIYTISESLLSPDLIWVGTDDGQLHGNQ